MNQALTFDAATERWEPNPALVAAYGGGEAARCLAALHFHEGPQRIQDVAFVMGREAGPTGLAKPNAAGTHCLECGQPMAAHAGNKCPPPDPITIGSTWTHSGCAYTIVRVSGQNRRMQPTGESTDVIWFASHGKDGGQVCSVPRSDMTAENGWILLA